jgi:hypothetical protein
MRDAQQAAITELAHARKRFADYARARLGLPEVNLFAQAGQGDQESPVLTGGNGQSIPTEVTGGPIAAKGLVKGVAGAARATLGIAPAFLSVTPGILTAVVVGEADSD